MEVNAEEAIGEGMRRGGDLGALLAFGPDLTIAEWSKLLGWSHYRVRKTAKALGVETRGMRWRRDKRERDALEQCERLTAAIGDALEHLATGDHAKARRVLRAVIRPG